MEDELKKLYLQFLKFQEKFFLKDKKKWFGVKMVKPKEKEVREVFFNYQRDSFLKFCKKIKDIIFAKNPLKEALAKWSMDNWYPWYYFKFLKEKDVIDLKRDGRVILRARKMLKILPRPLKEKEIKKKIEEKLKIKLNLQNPSNYLFKTKIKAHYDQFPISVSSAIFLVSKILEYLPLYQKFLFVGDDDLISFYCCLADKNFKAKVIDIDEALLKKIDEISKKYNLKIELEKVDISKKKKLNENFVGFLTSPVYTYEGVKIFVNFAVNHLSKDGGYGFLNLSDEAIGNRYLFLEEFFNKKNLIIEEVIKGKIYYPWQIVQPDDEIILNKYKEFFSKKVVESSPIISSSLWIFNYVPFKVPKPKKQTFFYAYL